MISTWGIFWICLFTASVISSSIKHFFPTKLSEKESQLLKELVAIFADHLQVKIETKPKVKKV